MSFQIHHGDALSVLRTLPDGSFDACLTDPPYGLAEARSPQRKNGVNQNAKGFMGMKWDAQVPGPEVWAEVLRVLKPGGMILAFGGTRTFHRLTCAIEDAGFEIRDCLMWIYGSGFPKSLDIAKAIDKVSPRVGQFDEFAQHYTERRKALGFTHNAICEHGKFYAEHNHGGASVNWEKGHNVPTMEQWRKLQPLLWLSEDYRPLIERVEAEREVLATRHDKGNRTISILGTEAKDYDITAPATPEAQRWSGFGSALKPAWEPIILAMKPLDGTFANNALKHGVAGLAIDAGRIGTENTQRPTTKLTSKGLTGGGFGNQDANRKLNGDLGGSESGRWPANLILDEESARLLDEASGELLASRFFYISKADSAERHASGKNNHPTVKPIDLAAYLSKLILPPERNTPRRLIVPFSGSGSEIIGALRAGWDHVDGIEQDAGYVELSRVRIIGDAPLLNEATA